MVVLLLVAGWLWPSHSKPRRELRVMQCASGFVPAVDGISTSPLPPRPCLVSRFVFCPCGRVVVSSHSIQTNPARLRTPPHASVNLEEPDTRTVALARGQEYLYGFKASDLPQELLDQVEEAGEETRKLAYVRWVVVEQRGRRWVSTPVFFLIRRKQFVKRASSEATPWLLSFWTLARPPAPECDHKLGAARV